MFRSSNLLFIFYQFYKQISFYPTFNLTCNRIYILCYYFNGIFKAIGTAYK